MCDGIFFLSSKVYLIHHWKLRVSIKLLTSLVTIFISYNENIFIVAKGFNVFLPFSTKDLQALCIHVYSLISFGDISKTWCYHVTYICYPFTYIYPPAHCVSLCVFTIWQCISVCMYSCLYLNSLFV